MILSESLYIRGVQYPKALWLKKYNPEILTPPDAVVQARFETGNVVGDWVCNLFLVYYKLDTLVIVKVLEEQKETVNH